MLWKLQGYSGSLFFYPSLLKLILVPSVNAAFTCIAHPQQLNRLLDILPSQNGLDVSGYGHGTSRTIVDPLGHVRCMGCIIHGLSHKWTVCNLAYFLSFWLLKSTLQISCMHLPSQSSSSDSGYLVRRDNHSHRFGEDDLTWKIQCLARGYFHKPDGRGLGVVHLPSDHWNHHFAT